MNINAVWEGLDVDREQVREVRPDEVDWSAVIDEIPAQISYETRLALAWAITSSTVNGECRVNGWGDLAQVFPVLDGNGLHWECNHLAPHKSEKVEALAP